MQTLNVNDRPAELDVEPEMPLLWALRDHLGLTGAKYACGIGACGSCAVLVDGQALRSCRLPVSAVGTRKVVTIEGLSRDGIHRVQQAWIDHQVPQCGYCQTGMILTVVALLARIPNPSDAQIDEAIGNLCRCGTYPRVRKAIHALAASASTASAPRG